MRQPVVAPLGIVTQPNQMGQYPAGAMSTMTNVHMRNPGVLTPAQARIDYAGAGLHYNSTLLPTVIPLDTQVVSFKYDSTLRWAQCFGAPLTTETESYITDPVTGNQAIDTTGYSGWTRCRDQLLFNTTTMIMVDDAVNVTGTPTARPAGLGQVTIFNLNQSASNGVATLTLNHCAYKALLTRLLPNGQLLEGVPSAAINAYNSTGATINWTMNLFGLPAVGVQVGDIVQLYRTFQQVASPTGSATNVGDDYYLCQTHTVVAGDITAGYFGTVLLDATPDSALGAPLYTNSGQGTADSTKLPPPFAKVLTTYKGYTFYGYRTDPAAIVLSIPGVFGNITTAVNRQFGIGERTFSSATFSSGSPTITAVSTADMVGVSVGQVINDFHLTGSSGSVLSFTATTITVSVNAASSGVSTVMTSQDAFVVNGAPYYVLDWSTFVLNFGTQTNLMLLANAPVFNSAHDPNYLTPTAFTLQQTRAAYGNFTIAASNGQNYIPPLPSPASPQTVIANVVKNGIAWSEQQQPEAVPPLNTAFVGSGEIQACMSTRDCVWFFCTDGLWRLSGTGGAAGRAGQAFDWRVDLVDSTLCIATPKSYTVLRDTVYAYTNRGLVSIDGDGNISALSEGMIRDQLPGQPFQASGAIFMEHDENWDEIYLSFSGKVWVYNTLTNTFTVHTQLAPSMSAMCWSRAQNDIVSAALTGKLYQHSQAGVYASGGNWLYQPLYGGTHSAMLLGSANGEPFSVKQWVDMVVVFDKGQDGTLFQFAYNTPSFTSANIPLKALANDARATVQVPRNTPAIAASVSPGIQVLSTAYWQFFGISLRTSSETEQAVKR